MSKTLRLSEKWFRRGLWLETSGFASFLTVLRYFVGRVPSAALRWIIQNLKRSNAAAQPAI